MFHRIQATAVEYMRHNRKLKITTSN